MTITFIGVGFGGIVGVDGIAGVTVGELGLRVVGLYPERVRWYGLELNKESSDGLTAVHDLYTLF